MPLLKRKRFTLAEPPKDLEEQELVYQVRFTKEIFSNYQEYLNRINLYRSRVWTCKYTGKSNLTYEEALVSEKHAAEKVQELPEELIAPAMHIIQFSMLSLKELADTIATTLQEHLFVGAELYGRKNDGMRPCKILKILEAGANKSKYEIGWIDRNKKTKETSIVDGEILFRTKLPFSRNLLKSFIRESTYRSLPWVLHDKLARKYGMPTDPPEELRNKVYFENGLLVCKKRKRIEEDEEDQLKAESLKYPIDDLLVLPGENDPVFSNRPSPSRDFSVPMDCVGDLLMVWDFCSSFGRLLHLWPFSLEDFEHAICHKESNLTLVVELHSVLLRFLIKDNSEHLMSIKNKKKKITLITWTEYLCDFLEEINNPELRSYTATIKRGHYGLLDPNAKLGILRELVNEALETGLIREKLDDHIEQRHALGANRREQALEEARKKREDKERLKSQPLSVVNGLSNGHSMEKSNQEVSPRSNHIRQNGETGKKRMGEMILSEQKNQIESKNLNSAAKMSKKQNMDVKVTAENGKILSRKAELQQLREDKESTEKMTKEQRKEYFEREIEKRIIRTNSLGKDRHYNRYWWFRRDGRIFVESSDSNQWGFYSSKEELDALMGSLNPKGERERALQAQLEKFYSKISSALLQRSKNSANRIALEEAVLRRSTRVRAHPKENPANAFLRYVNKWKED